MITMITGALTPAPRRPRRLGRLIPPRPVLGVLGVLGCLLLVGCDGFRLDVALDGAKLATFLLPEDELDGISHVPSRSDRNGGDESVRYRTYHGGDDPGSD
jgi:hypothetical protein